MKLRFAPPICILFLAAYALPAQDKMTKDALVAKAIEASGAEGYKKFLAATEKVEGKMYMKGMEIAVNGDTVRMEPGKVKTTLNLDVGGQKLKMVRIIDGDKVRTFANGNETPVQEGQIRELKESTHASRLEKLLALRDDKDLNVKLLDGTSKVEDKEAYVLEVKAKDLPDVKLFFDAKTFLLTKAERKARGEDGNDVLNESFHYDHKKVEGITSSTRGKVLRDGKPYLDAKLTEVKRMEKVDPKEFGVSD